MERLELSLAQPFLNRCFPLEALVAVPEQAEGLDQNRRAQEKQQQDAEACVGHFLVESHNSPYVQPNVEQQEHQTHASEEEIQRGVPEHTHCACENEVFTYPT